MFLERDRRVTHVPCDVGAEAIDHIFCAVSHAAVEALADQWKITLNSMVPCPKSGVSTAVEWVGAGGRQGDAHKTVQCGWGCC